MLIPGPREEAFRPLGTRKNLVIAVPLVSRQLVGHLNTIAIGVTEIDPNGDPVIRDVIDLDVFVLEPLVDFFQVVEAMHHPGHVIETYLPLLRTGSVIPHLDERHLM